MARERGTLILSRWPALLLPLLLLGLAGCSSLPTIVPDLARTRAAPVQLVGSQGLLSAGRSKAILAGLQAPGEDTGIFDRHLALEESIVGSPLTTGNAVRLLEDGPATYRAMLAAMAAARDHINMQTYILDDDEVGRHFAEVLISKQQQGVQVNLIRDSVGTLSTPLAFFERLAASGISIVEFNPVNPLKLKKDWQLNQRDHRKLLVVDGQTAFLGGINISSVYSSGSSVRGAPPQADLAWRDTDLQLQGPVVAELQKLFIASWESQRGPALAPRNYFPRPLPGGRQVVRAIGSAPDDPFSLIYATLLSAITNAETSILISNAYFAPDPQLLAALQAAARRGVDVTLILPGKTDSMLVFHAGRAHYTPLLEAGVKIYERRGAILHSKTALIDGVWATVGSTNLDWRSFLHNHELNAVVLGVEFGQQLRALFERDLAASEQITLQAWQQRQLHLRLLEVFADAWAYWL